jgi:two-component system sensor kinase FixL
MLEPSTRSSGAGVESQQALRVLIVEDDADTRSNLSDILELDGFTIDCAATGQEALQLPRLAEFSAILLDRRLPDTTADLLLPKIRALAPDVAVIIVTGFADVAGIVSAMREGAADYIFKPVNVDLLRASVARVVERNRLRQAMRRSESAQHLLMESVPCIVLALRDDGTIAYFNEFAAALTGYRQADVVGRRFRDVLRPEVLRPGEAVRVAYDPPAQRQTHDDEVTIVCADSSIRWTIWNWNTHEDAAGAPLRLGVAQDISARKAAEERAVQNERLAAIGQAMTGLVHESRNALQRSKACLEMLALEVDKNSAAMELLGRVQKAQENLHQLFEEVREYAAPLRLDLQPCDLKTVLHEAWDYLALARHGSEIRLIESFEGQLDCAADRFRIAQVFRNILENAVQVSPRDGQITVEVGPDAIDGEEAIRVAIRDEGPGFSDEQKQRIFEPFFTTKTKGTGLGMAICQRIVLAHGGQISVGSSGVGAEIVIRLPRGNL